MKKCVSTLNSAPIATVDVPEHFPRKRGEKGDPRKIERHSFGSIRFFPGIPRTVSSDELEYVELHRPDVFARLQSRKYVESKRVCYRGATEAEVEKLAAEAGISHLSHADQIARLEKSGKLKRRDPKTSNVVKVKVEGTAERKRSGNGGKIARKPR